MPALEAFGRKWNIGSDDLVFPYVGSILMRIVWFTLIGAVLLTYDSSYKCDDERLLKIYLFLLTALHLTSAIVEVSIVVISASGTIANPTPRRNIRIPLYILMAIFVVEFAWDIVGVLWAFDPTIDCHKSHAVLLLARTVLVWNFIGSVTLGSYLLLRIGLCRIPCYCCCDPNKKLKYEKLNPTTTYDGRRLSKASSETLVHHRRQRAWQWRMQCIFCWLRLRGEQKTVFADVAATLADAFNQFRGYVPSDILAGIILYAFHHKTEHYSNSELRKPVDFKNDIVSKHYNRAVHYMKFAAAAYGNSAYLHHQGIFCGCLKLTGYCTCCCVCCFKGKKDDKENDKENDKSFGVKPGCCGCELAALKKTAGIEADDIVYVSMKSEVFCPAFFVAIDHKHKAVVISIRGTLSIYDVLTDLSAEPEIASTCESGDVYGHKGMMTGAHGVQLRLEEDEILPKAFRANSHYRLVIVGHSLGAGAAALLAVILKPKYPKLQCFAYAPPGAIVNRDAIPYTRAFITSVILGSDIVPRLHPESFDALSINVLDLLQNCKVPKYRIFMDSFFYWLGCCRPCLLKKKRLNSTTELVMNRDPNTINDFDASYEEEDIYDVVADMKLLRASDRITGKERMSSRVKMPLFIPGRILHITWDTPKAICCGLIKMDRLQAHWTAQSEFSVMSLERNAIKHHLPYVLYDNMQRLQKQKKTLQQSELVE